MYILIAIGSSKRCHIFAFVYVLVLPNPLTAEQAVAGSFFGVEKRYVIFQKRVFL